MRRNMSGLRGVPLLLLVIGVVGNALLVTGSLHPLSDTEKDAARQLFVAGDDGLFGGLEETYEAVRSLQVLKSGGYDAKKISKFVSDVLASPSSSLDVKDIFYGLRTIELLHGHEHATVSSTVLAKLVNAVKEAQSLVDLYFSVGALATIKKKQGIQAAVVGVLPRVKDLEDSQGKWFSSQDKTDSSVESTGFSLAIAAWVVQISGLEGHKSELQSMKTAVGKALDNIELYEQGIQSLDAVSASSALLNGVVGLAGALPHGIKVKEEQVFRLAKFLVTYKPDSPKAAYFQLDALGILDDNKLLVPLAVQLSTSVLSLTSHDSLEVLVTTVLGSPPPEISVTVISAYESGKEGSPVLTGEELVAHKGKHSYSFDFLSKNIDVGKYELKLAVKPVSADLVQKYTAGKLSVQHIVVAGIVSVSSVELAVLNSDSGIPESKNSLDSSKKDQADLIANHLQKLRLSFELTSPKGGPYHPQQTFLKLSHESGVEHIFVVQPHGKFFEKTLDFLGLLDHLYYLSGIYSLEIIIGDVTMENSFSWTLGSLDLDLPNIPEGATKPPAVAKDFASNFGPKSEISHIFRQPEKRPRADVSYAFLVLTLLPLVGFIVGLYSVGASLKNFPTSGPHRLAAAGFHLGIGSILVLYYLFWVRLNLFTTLKVLCFLGVATSVTGHFILAYLSDHSSKVKTT